MIEAWLREALRMSTELFGRKSEPMKAKNANLFARIKACEHEVVAFLIFS